MKVVLRDSAVDDLDRILIEYPYIIVYRVDDQRREIAVLAILHWAQGRGTWLP